LSPVQVAIIPVSEKFEGYAKKVEGKLLEKDVRVEMSLESESLGKRISQAEKQKTPYMIVIGEKEQESKTVTIRKRGEKIQETLSLEDFVEKMTKEISNKSL
ncbi:MAG TPA: threonine--tRNA ligase, partial [Candidatus Moranbacteria bacterium]|nr:threonine--tRNA ligase [Candidatus Moranbacteria bacterium]